MSNVTTTAANLGYTTKKPELTDLDRKLQEIALINWPQFIKLVGKDAILGAKICLLRKNERSYGEICQKLKVPVWAARTKCKQCVE